jgi:hypothetical protein
MLLLSGEKESRERNETKYGDTLSQIFLTNFGQGFLTKTLFSSF